MREIDEAEEQMTQLRQKKRKILAAVVLGILCVSFYGWWRKTVPPSDAAIVSQTATVEAAHKAQGEVVVYVSGLVEHPGLVKVPAGARALDAVNAAGGLLPGADVSKVNLAQALRDGMQIHVSGQAVMAKESSGQYSGSTGAQTQSQNSNSAAEKININTADATQLDKLPGVGPAMAAKIVEWRKANGPFQAGEDLKKVKGLGEAKYQKLKDKISW
ncbi:MAG TPA: ComEA family DNA-binding protein [Negativicutes bacterium]|nr:ComEA family DNA-binding protein [Negativicutes bacterium]